MNTLRNSISNQNQTTVSDRVDDLLETDTAKGILSNGKQVSMLMNVSPELAREWLERNSRNRNISLRAVSRIKNDILSGRWMTTHQGIAFYTNGSLADGQHRLMAIAEAGVTVYLQVTFGLPLDAILAIDQHRMRTTHDVIKLSQKADWIEKDVISVLRCILGMHGGNRTSSISASEVIRLAELIKPRLIFSRGFLHKASVRGITIAPVAAAFSLALGYENESRLKLFADVLKTGIMSCDDDVAAIRLRESLINTVTGGDSERRVVMLRSQKAIKVFCERRIIKKLQTPSEWIYPFPEELATEKEEDQTRPNNPPHLWPV